MRRVDRFLQTPENVSNGDDGDLSGQKRLDITLKWCSQTIRIPSRVNQSQLLWWGDDWIVAGLSNERDCIHPTQ